MKQIVFINHSWISPTIKRGWTLQLGRVAYDCCLSLSLEIQETLQSKVYTRITSFNMYHNFRERVLIKTQISEIYTFLLGHG